MQGGYIDGSGGANESPTHGKADASSVEEKELVQMVKIGKTNNVLSLWGNQKTMNFNPLILSNIQSSHYFKVTLYQLKTYHEVIDEIYYNVRHLEPWEKGSRKTSGQTGMCGGVRGVAAGGIVSTAFCILYKLFTLKLTRKQLTGLLNHADSPYIRALGYMFCQPPSTFWEWYESYLEDEEEIDVRAGGGHVMTIGDMLRHFLTRLDWYSALFPRIPVPIEKDLKKKLEEKFPPKKTGPQRSVRPDEPEKVRRDDDIAVNPATQSHTRSRSRDQAHPPVDTSQRHSFERDSTHQAGERRGRDQGYNLRNDGHRNSARERDSDRRCQDEKRRDPGDGRERRYEKDDPGRLTHSHDRDRDRERRHEREERIGREYERDREKRYEREDRDRDKRSDREEWERHYKRDRNRVKEKRSNRSRSPDRVDGRKLDKYSAKERHGSHH